MKNTDRICQIRISYYTTYFFREFWIFNLEKSKLQNPKKKMYLENPRILEYNNKLLWSRQQYFHLNKFSCKYVLTKKTMSAPVVDVANSLQNRHCLTISLLSIKESKVTRWAILLGSVDHLERIAVTTISVFSSQYHLAAVFFLCYKASTSNITFQIPLQTATIIFLQYCPSPSTDFVSSNKIFVDTSPFCAQIFTDSTHYQIAFWPTYWWFC